MSPNVPAMTDAQIAELERLADEGLSFTDREGKRLLAEVKRLREQEHYMREQIEQLAQVADERKTRETAYRALAEEHQKRGDKLSAQLAEIGEPELEWGVAPAGRPGEVMSVGKKEAVARKSVANDPQDRMLMSRPAAGKWRMAEQEDDNA